MNEIWPVNVNVVVQGDWSQLGHPHRFSIASKPKLRQNKAFLFFRNNKRKSIVSSPAVIRVVTKRFSPAHSGVAWRPKWRLHKRQFCKLYMDLKLQDNGIGLLDIFVFLSVNADKLFSFISSRTHLSQEEQLRPGWTVNELILDSIIHHVRLKVTCRYVEILPTSEICFF